MLSLHTVSSRGRWCIILWLFNSTSNRWSRIKRQWLFSITQHFVYLFFSEWTCSLTLLFFLQKAMPSLYIQNFPQCIWNIFHRYNFNIRIKSFKNNTFHIIAYCYFIWDVLIISKSSFRQNNNILHISSVIINTIRIQIQSLVNIREFIKCLPVSWF